MFDNLVESNPKSANIGQKLSSSTLSFAIHGLMIWGAVAATMRVTEEVTEVAIDTQMIFLEEEPEEQKPEEAPPPPKLLNLAPPKGFKTLSAPVDVPTEIPDINLSEEFDPRDYSGVGVEGGIFEGVEDGPIDLAQVFNEAVVDEPPVRISSPPLEYPRTMQRAGIEGMVLLQGVVDTTGHIEPKSMVVVRADQKAFEAPAKQLLRRSLFRPGRVRGRPVRVLIQLPIQFSLIGGL
ncbi:MAG: TonB family protein [Gemmatimonadales bacterium]